MANPFERFLPALAGGAKLTPTDPALRLWSEGALSCHYAPFDHIHPGARVVLLGITPGMHQAQIALSTLQQALAAGVAPDLGLARAKLAASFSGPMRSNLVDLLDAVGVHRAIGIGSCYELFGARADLVHFTSALRYPVFLNGTNYAGTPPVLSTPILKVMVDTWLREEIAKLRTAFWVPLGKEPSSVLQYFVDEGIISETQVLHGLPHPSGANAERIAYFLGRKERSTLSTKTNPELLDAMRERLQRQVSATRIEQVESATTALSPVKCTKMTGSVDPAPVVAPVKGDNERFASSFRLISHGGEMLYPVRVRNRETGRRAFNLAKRGAGTHTRVHRIEVEDEVTAYKMVASGTYKIRATRGAGDAPSLLGLGDRVVKAVVLI